MVTDRIGGDRGREEAVARAAGRRARGQREGETHEAERKGE